MRQPRLGRDGRQQERPRLLSCRVPQPKCQAAFSSRKAGLILSPVQESILPNLAVEVLNWTAHPVTAPSHQLCSMISAAFPGLFWGLSPGQLSSLLLTTSRPDHSIESEAAL